MTWEGAWTENWAAVAAALRERLDERGMTMTDLAARSGVSLTTVRELVHVLNTRRRQPRTLASLSTALGWPAEHWAPCCAAVPSPAPPANDLAAIRRELRDLRQRV